MHARNAAFCNTCDMDLNARDIFGDGDQTFIRLEKKQEQLSDVVQEGADLHGKLQAQDVSDFFLSCYSSNVEAVKHFIRIAKAMEMDIHYTNP